MAIPPLPALLLAATLAATAPPSAPAPPTAGERLEFSVAVGPLPGAAFVRVEAAAAAPEEGADNCAYLPM